VERLIDEMFRLTPAIVCFTFAGYFAGQAIVEAFFIRKD